jgi:adenylate cyclase
MSTREDPNSEYERRFLVSDTAPLRGARGDRIEQGYLWAKDGYAVRVRLTSNEEDSDALAFFTLKGPRARNVRFELEQPLPISEARALYQRSSYRVSKMRYPVISEGETWVVDVFEGANEGLVIAEFEASRAAVAWARKPWWCSTEITGDRRYDNENLAREPYQQWSNDPGTAVDPVGRTDSD